ncbi:MAG: pyrimidine 5'-nucleotidase [Anaerolineae bacterium]
MIVLFDLDDTLYPAGAGLMAAISDRITAYMVEYLGMARDQAEQTRHDYYRRYGSSTRGLVLHHAIDLPRYLSYVHDIPVEAYLAPDPDLDCLLACIEAPKGLFTNAPSDYAHRVLRALGVMHRFGWVFDIEFGGYRGKPDPSVYRRVARTLHADGDGVRSAERIEVVMLDDALPNLVPARELGWTTVWVGGDSAQTDGVADFVVGDLLAVGSVFHELGLLNADHHALWARCLGACRLGKGGREEITRR